MSEADDLKNLPAKVAGMNELERAYQTLDRYPGRPAPSYGGEEAGPKSEFSMRDIFYVLFRHKWKIVLIFLALSAGTVFYIATMGQLYEAEARVFIRGVRVGEVINPTGEGNSGFLTGSRDGSSVRSEIGVMTSQELAQEVVDQLGPDAVLGIDRNAPPRPRSAVARFIEQTPWASRTVAAIQGGVEKALNTLHLAKPPLTLQQQAVQAILGGLDVAETMQTSNVLRVTYRASSPKTAQAVLNALIDAYKQKNIEIHKAPVSPEFFQKKIAELRTQLTDKENQLDAERKRLNVSSLENQKAMLLNQYNTFDTELKNNAMRITALTAKITQFDQLTNKRKGSAKGTKTAGTTAAPRNNPVLDQIRGRLLELKLKEADLASRFTDKNGELIDVRNQIQEMEKLLRGEAASDKDGTGLGAGMDLIAQADSPGNDLEMQAILAKVELEAENASEGMLVKQLNNTRMELDKLLGNEKELKGLEREVSLIENEYRQYLNSRQVAEVSEKLDQNNVSNVSIVQRATLPTEPVKSQRKLLALLGFGIFLSLAAGMGWAFGLEFCDHSIKTNEDVEKYLGLPVLVALPYVKDHKPLLQEGNS